MTNQPIGVITYSEDSLRPLLEGHEQRSRIQVLGLDDTPDWTVLQFPDWWDRDGRSFDGLREQLIDRLGTALATGGALEGVRILILECTVLPNFRSHIRAVVGFRCSTSSPSPPPRSPDHNEPGPFPR